MTQLLQPQAIPYVQRRQASGIYRVVQAQVGATSFATKRVLGMWIPADAFRRGTIIRCTGHSSTNGVAMRIGIGGPGNVAAGGVVGAWTAGPAAPCGFDLRMTQRIEGVVGPSFDTSGFFAGSTSLVVSTAAFTPFIQPLNYVELNTNGTFSLSGCILEVIPPQWNARPNGEMFDV